MTYFNANSTSQAEDAAALEASTTPQAVVVPTYLFSVDTQETTQRVYREMVAKVAHFKILDDNYEQVTFPEGADVWSMACEIDSGPGDFGDNSVITGEFNQEGKEQNQLIYQLNDVKYNQIFYIAKL